MTPSNRRPRTCAAKTSSRNLPSTMTTRLYHPDVDRRSHRGAPRPSFPRHLRARDRHRRRRLAARAVCVRVHHQAGRGSASGVLRPIREAAIRQVPRRAARQQEDGPARNPLRSGGVPRASEGEGGPSEAARQLAGRARQSPQDRRPGGSACRGGAGGRPLGADAGRGQRGPDHAGGPRGEPHRPAQASRRSACEVFSSTCRCRCSWAS